MFYIIMMCRVERGLEGVSVVAETCAVIVVSTRMVVARNKTLDGDTPSAMCRGRCEQRETVVDVANTAKTMMMLCKAFCERADCFDNSLENDERNVTKPSSVDGLARLQRNNS